MKYLSQLLLLLLSVCCSPKTEYIFKDNNSVLIKTQSMKIPNFREVSWSAGLIKGEKHKVSRGFYVQLSMPDLSMSELKDLYSNQGVDGWMLRIRKSTPTQDKYLKNISVPLLTKSPGTGKSRFDQLKTVTIYLFYYASFVDSFYASLPCPQYGHRSYISNISKADLDQSEANILISKTEQKSFISDFDSFNYGKLVINLGKKAIGDYYFEFAPFNRKTKTLKGNFAFVGEKIRITHEAKVDLPSCENYEIPNRDDYHYDKWQLFNFGGD